MFFDFYSLTTLLSVIECWLLRLGFVVGDFCSYEMKECGQLFSTLLKEFFRDDNEGEQIII